MPLSKEQFIQALSTDGILTEKRQNFLIALSSYSNQSATPNQVADKLGYKNKVVVNGLIGSLGKAIANLYGIEKEKPEDEWWPIVADWFREGGDFHWQMHENLYNAMIELNIISYKTGSSTDDGSFEEDFDYSEDEIYTEGHSKIVYVNRYERNPKARRVCIAHYGISCQVCSLDFEEVYGREIGAGFIHVHHLIELSTIAEEYEVDPINDLRPVCPNCHAMLHRRRPAYSVEEISDLLHAVSNRNNS